MPDKRASVQNNNGTPGARRPVKRPDYATGNENWNTSAYEKSVKTEHTDTTAYKSEKGRTVTSPYYFDNTAAALRERRIKRAGERRTQMRKTLGSRSRQAVAVRRILSLLIIIGLFIGAGATSYKLFFVVSAVSINGETSYTEEEIVKATGLDSKPNLYSFSSKDALRALSFFCPRITEAKIDRTMPDKVTITVTEEKPAYYAEIYGDLFAISESLKVMDKISPAEAEGLIRLRLQDVASAVSGSPLTLVSERAQVFLEEALSYISNSPLKSKLTQIDLRNDFNTVMIAEDKFKLVFGTQEDFEIKVRLAAATLEDEMFKTGSRALVNLQDTSKTSVIIDNQLDFDK